MGMNKCIRKNGKFRMRLHAYLFIPISMAVALSFMSACTHSWSGYIASVCLAAGVALHFYELYTLYRKKCHLSLPMLYIEDGHHHTSVIIPEQYTIIVSSLALPLKMYQYGTYMVKGSVCLSIVAESDITSLNTKLHQDNNMKRYTNCIVKNNFNGTFVESFVHDMSLPPDLWKNARYVIIAESVGNLIDIRGHNVIYDVGY